jgi:hypothetical protein
MKTYFVGGTDGKFRSVSARSERRAVQTFIDTYSPEVGTDLRIMDKDDDTWYFYRVSPQGTPRKLPGSVPRGSRMITANKRNH